MTRMLPRLITGLCVLALSGPAVFGDSKSGDAKKGEGVVFKLAYESLPTESGRPNLSLLGMRPEKLRDVPDGVDAKSAEGTTIDLSALGFGKRQVVLVRSKHDFYVDMDGDGRFGPKERINVKHPSRLVKAIRSQPDYHYCFVCPVKLTAGKGDEAKSFSIGFQIAFYRGGCHLAYGSATVAAGDVKLGDQKIRMAVYPTSLSRGFDRGIEFGERRPSIGCQLLLDVNGNGRYDRFSPRGMGPENRWLTRLLRFGGTYYELAVAADGSSVRITPTSPKLAKLKIPKYVETASLIGPEFATIATSSDKEIELPVGTYSIYYYRYNKGGTYLSARDYEGNATFDVKAGQSNTFRVGPPLKVAVTTHTRTGRGQSARRPRQVYFSFEPRDCESRSISDLGSGRSRRPPAPRLKVVDSRGKQVLDASFEYG